MGGRRHSSDDISFCLRHCIAVGVVITFGHYGFCRYLVVHANPGVLPKVI